MQKPHPRAAPPRPFPSFAAVLLAVLAPAQAPSGAGPPPGSTDAAVARVLVLKQAFRADCAAAAATLLGAIDAKIARITNDTSTDIQVRTDRIAALTQKKQRFEQSGELPADEFPDAARKYHRDMATARATCRREVKLTTRRLKDHAAAIAMLGDLDGWCPRLIAPDDFLAGVKPVLRDLDTRNDAGKALVAAKNAMAEAVRDCEAGKLPAEVVTARTRSLCDALKATRPFLDDKRNKPLHQKVVAAVAALEKLLKPPADG